MRTNFRNLLKPALILAVVMCCFYSSFGQKYEHNIGFIYVKGMRWIENQKQDSVKKIIIEIDTMVAVRNLLIYCMQEKEEGDNARILLSMINLDVLKNIMKSKEFDFYLKEYRKVVAKNEKYRNKYFPEYQRK